MSYGAPTTIDSGFDLAGAVAGVTNFFKGIHKEGLASIALPSIDLPNAIRAIGEGVVTDVTNFVEHVHSESSEKGVQNPGANKQRSIFFPRLFFFFR